MTGNEGINTLVIASVLGGQASNLAHLLREGGFSFTEVDSRMSLMQEPVTAMLIGINHSRLDGLIQMVRQCCPEHLEYIPARMDIATFQGQPLMIEALQGGATLFAVEVEQFIQL